MYFKNLPDILYLKYKKNPFDGNYILIKNIFARIKLVDDIIPSATIFDDYFIQDGERPDTIANDFYESPYKDWVIILINNINNLYSDWPLTRSAFDDYVRSKYSNPEAPHHYETIEQYYNGNLLLPGGLQVGESFQYKKLNLDFHIKTHPSTLLPKNKSKPTSNIVMFTKNHLYYDITKNIIINVTRHT